MLYNIEELGFVWFRYEGCFKGFPVIKYTYVAHFKVTKWFALPCMFRLFVRFTEAYSESCQRSKIKSSHQRCSVKKGFLRNFAKFPGKQLCKSLFFIKVAGLRPATLLRKRLAQVVSCEFCGISKNTFSTEHLWWLLLILEKDCFYKLVFSWFFGIRGSLGFSSFLSFTDSRNPTILVYCYCKMELFAK